LFAQKKQSKVTKRLLALAALPSPRFVMRV